MARALDEGCPALPDLRSGCGRERVLGGTVVADLLEIGFEAGSRGAEPVETERLVDPAQLAERVPDKGLEPDLRVRRRR